MNIKELQLKEIPELNQLLSAAKKQLGDLGFKVHQGQLKSVREIRVIKKDVTRLMTVINSKKK
ncbi:MAG: 50S ribosomal protein L29 [Candidatus Buchananbacteria bacterium]|jgi:ribosomal protein L29